jgi:hypothetical protein
MCQTDDRQGRGGRHLKGKGKGSTRARSGKARRKEGRQAVAEEWG